MTIKIERGAVSVEISPTTPRGKMVVNSLIRSAIPWYADYAKLIGVDEDTLDSVLTDFLTFSGKVKNPVGLDFELATLADSQEEVIRKFELYLDTQFGELVTAAMSGIRNLDQPNSRAKQPVPLGENDPKDSTGSEQSGKAQS